LIPDFSQSYSFGVAQPILSPVSRTLRDILAKPWHCTASVAVQFWSAFFCKSWSWPKDQHVSLIPIVPEQPCPSGLRYYNPHQLCQSRRLHPRPAPFPSVREEQMLCHCRLQCIRLGIFEWHSTGLKTGGLTSSLMRTLPNEEPLNPWSSWSAPSACLVVHHIPSYDLVVTACHGPLYTAGGIHTNFEPCCVSMSSDDRDAGTNRCLEY
jgi:hypothetical protein